MTYRGQVINGSVVLDPPVQLPEGACVEVSVLPPHERQPPLTSIEQLRGGASGDDDFGEEFEQTVRNWRNEPWRASPQEPPE